MGMPKYLSVIGMAIAMGANAAETEFELTTHTYKTVDGLEIRADVHRINRRINRPLVVWIHGGALIMGHRASVPDRVMEFCRENEYTVVSIDYRLAPETKLPEIISDLEDAFSWIRREGPAKFGADPERIAVMGGSAGGYLTLTAGFRIEPRPTLLVAFWGYGDLVGDWYSQPSPHPRHHRSRMSKEEAWQQVSGPPISDARNRNGNGGAFYQFCRRTGDWPRAVSNWDPRAQADQFAPYMPVKNVSPEYPPTFLIHGTDDTDVPHEQSAMMAEQFKLQQVEHRLVSIAGGEHGLGGGNPGEIAAAYRAAFAFARSKLGE